MKYRRDGKNNLREQMLWCDMCRSVVQHWELRSRYYVCPTGHARSVNTYLAKTQLGMNINQKDTVIPA